MNAVPQPFSVSVSGGGGNYAQGDEVKIVSVLKDLSADNPIMEVSACSCDSCGAARSMAQSMHIDVDLDERIFV